MDYLSDDQTVHGIDIPVENVDGGLMFATCITSPKSNTLEGQCSGQNSDQFVQFTSEGALMDLPKPDLQSVCNPAFPVTASIFANTTNTATSITSILTQTSCRPQNSRCTEISGV